MKTLHLLLLFLYNGIVFSQQIDFKNNKFYVDGQHVYKHEIIETFKENEQALELFKKFRTKESVGWFILSAGIELTFVDIIQGVFFNASYPSAFSYIGVGLAAISIPILSGRTKMLQESMAVFNQNTKDKQTDLGTNFEINIIGNQKGIGLNITF